MLKTEHETTVFSDEGDDTLGGRLSMARDAAGISLESLASQLGVGQETMIAWNPTVRNRNHPFWSKWPPCSAFHRLG